jgi:hypothetical protein
MRRTAQQEERAKDEPLPPVAGSFVQPADRMKRKKSGKGVEKAC